MKKITLFLTFTLALMASGIAQTTDSQNVNNEKTYYVLIETSYGNMTAKLYNETPLHRDNFVKLVQEGFYDSLLFHRVINHFMIQGGDPLSRNAKYGQILGEGDLGYLIPAEFNPALYHKKGALAAARTGDDVNPQKQSSSCQFYIVQGQPGWSEPYLARFGNKYTAEQKETYRTLGGTPHLDMAYTVFGEIVEGLEVIDRIAAVNTDQYDRPAVDVRMKITLIEK